MNNIGTICLKPCIPFPIQCPKPSFRKFTLTTILRSSLQDSQPPNSNQEQQQQQQLNLSVLRFTLGLSLSVFYHQFLSPIRNEIKWSNWGHGYQIIGITRKPVRGQESTAGSRVNSWVDSFLSRLGLYTNKLGRIGTNSRVRGRVNEFRRKAQNDPCVGRLGFSFHTWTCCVRFCFGWVRRRLSRLAVISPSRSVFIFR